jgi:hypothetical protein
MTKHLIQATQWLEFFEDYPEYHRLCYDGLCSELKASHLTPEDIGTTEAHIQELHLKGCRVAALEVFNELVSAPEDHHILLPRLWRELEAGKLTLEDIGKTGAEIKSLIKKHIP